MDWTKSKLIDEIFAELGMPVYVFDILPEQRMTVLTSMEALVATWESKSIRLGYVFGEDENVSSGILDGAATGIVTNVAIRVAGKFGKTPSPDTVATAQETLEIFMITAAQPLEMQLGSKMPRGAGHKYWRGWQRPFLNAPDNNPVVNNPNLADFDIKKG